MATPVGVSVAFGQDALTATPTFTRIDDPAGINVVNRWSVKRGRSYFTNRTDTGTAQADFIDTAGKLDPTNSTGPFYPMDPNCPFAIALHNPVSGATATVFTGLVQQVPQTLDVSGKVATGSVMAADMFSLLAIGEIEPGLDFDSSAAGTSAANTVGDTTFAAQDVQARIKALLADAGVPSGLTDVFSGNVDVQACVYPPGTTYLEAIWDAADAEFPGLANCYVSKTGKFTFHGRLARFNPTDSQYGISTWNVGDTAAVSGSTALALVSEISFDRDVAKVINASLFSPDGIDDGDIPAQLSAATASVAQFGNRTWSGTNLLTADGLNDSLGANAETALFSQYYVDNFADAQTRISQLSFKWVPTSAPNAAAHWAFLCGVEISDLVNVTTTHPGGGGFSAEPYFVEGISYEMSSAGASGGVDLTLTLDLSPQAYFNQDPFS